ncbi:galactose-1-epimerase [Phyllobacterium phragmitis]|uniref:Aldose 1-epimerase n=1 Tax=Phyllobacterium phragmitis TaxID=2670329 RepID=A0A2S9IMA6_9HYPH|nr:aldose epimerase family protein [Phyllobacterium phragmitis]PRD41661.1 galactose-1-epimerase [Phyllobacterium phragmitis]
MKKTDYGHLAGGQTVHAIDIGGPELSARILTYGATLADLTIQTGNDPHSVILGFDRLEDYLAQTAYVGAIAGRCANRIAGGRFTLDGVDHQLSLNENGRTHLHGGVEGFSRKLWSIADAGPSSVTLTLVSPHDDEGYPGEVRVICRYSIERMTLTLELTAETDRPTLVNPAGHAYFNLDGSDTILDHRLTIPANAYTPVDSDLIPSGEIADVAGTIFDFSTPRPIRSGNPHAGYDHNFVLAMQPAAVPRPAARLEGPQSGLAMEIWATEPGLQFYDGNFLPLPQPLRGGRQGERFGGLCLEPQRFPDAIHHPHFPGSVLRPGEIYRQVTQYVFSRED